MKMVLFADDNLMKKTNFENQFEIYLFNDEQTDEAPSKLNEFISFLKFNKASIPYKFSFVGNNPTLISDLTIKQNILIDFNADSLTESRDAQFSEYLKNIANYYLTELYDRIDLPTELPAMANCQMRKLAGLIKCLIKNGDFIFLESPEEHLDAETLETFVSALKQQMKIKKQNVFISSKNISFWKMHAHFTVGRNKDYSFNCKELSHEILDVDLYESFYKDSEVNSDILKFNIPSKKDAEQKQYPTRVSKIKIA